MLENEKKPIRYHLPKDFLLDFDEPVFLEKIQTGTLHWVRQCNVPAEAKTPELLQRFLRETALTQGGEAWRAVTERDEVLRLFSVYDLTQELSGKKTITINPNDRYFLGVAHGWLDLPPPC